MLLDMLQELEDIVFACPRVEDIFFDPRSMGICKILSSSSAPQEDKMTENKQARQR
jgi:hypothetical protein